MPRKKKEPEVKKSSYVDDDGFACLPGDMFWRWRAHDAEVRAHTSELASLATKISEELSKLPELAKLLSQKAATAAELSLARKALDELLAEVTAATGIEPKDMVINDKTGRLFTMLPDGTVGPAVKAKRRRKQTTD